MNGDGFDPKPAAQLLADAWRCGESLVELPTEIRPRSIAQGYDVQDVVMAELGASTAGWKLGVGSLAQKRSGVARSIAGRILGSQVYRVDETVMLPKSAPITVEFEVVYVLGRDVLPGDSTDSLLDAVAETRVAFEIVQSRFINRRAVGWPSFAADNAAFQALVLGDPIDGSRLSEVLDSLIVSVDGEERARQTVGDDVTDPAGAFADLVDLARERRFTLPRGSIVSTGAASCPFDLSGPAAKIGARFLDSRLDFQTSFKPSIHPLLPSIRPA